MSVTWDKMEPGLYYEVTEGSTDGTFKTGDVVRRLDCGIEPIGNDDKYSHGGFYPNVELETKPQMADFQSVLWVWEYGRNFLLSLLSDSDCDIIELQKYATMYKQRAMECIYTEMTRKNIHDGAEIMRVYRWLHELVFRRLKEEYI